MHLSDYPFALPKQSVHDLTIMWPLSFSPCTPVKMLCDLLSDPVVLLPTLGVISLLMLLRRRNPPLPNIPIVGARKGDWFPLLQAKWRNTRDFMAAMELAHAQQRDRAVLLPVANAGDIVMLPRSEISFVADQPDSVLSFNDRAFELYQIGYTFIDPNVPRVTLHESLLRTALTPQIGNLIPALDDEVTWAFEKHWGSDTSQWSEVCVFETMRHITGGVANRALVGLPHCRDPELVNNGMAFAVDIPLSGAILNLFWKPLRPLVAPFVTIPNRIHTRRFRKILRSEIDRRLRDYDLRQQAVDAKPLGPEPNDFLQWSIQQAKAHGNPYMWRNETLADRVLIVNFAAIHTTSFTLTWLMFDLASTSQENINQLRNEATSVLAAHGGQWTKRALSELVNLDSAMRESARLSSILTIGLGRVVVARDGLTTPSGVHLVRGTHVSVPVYSVMRDDTVYPDAGNYHPFRFSQKMQRSSPSTLPTTSADFLAFGHGKHACPGRFFAAAEMKLIAAHVILHYDFELLGGVKPEGPWYGVTRVPPMKDGIRIKRREHKVSP